MSASLRRRLLPLYIFSFAQGLILWYSIEKVFMTHIGFTPATIALAVAVGGVAGLALNVPSGIWADRNSRKRVLVLATLSLGVASWLMGISKSVPEYIIAGLFFAVYASLHSGVFDSMLYDTLLEEQGSRAGYEKVLGNSQFFIGTANIIGSLLGATIGASISLSAPYLLSLPAVGLALTSLLFFREPRLHQQHQPETLLAQIRQLRNFFGQRGPVRWALIALVATTITYEFMLEVDQLWPLALHLPTAYYGPLNALLLLGFAVGGPLAAYVVAHTRRILTACIIGVASVLALVVPSIAIVAAAQTLTLTIFLALYTILLGKLHDTAPSHLRSGISSAAGMISGGLFIPLVLAFGLVAQRASVFVAAWMLVPFAVIAVFGVMLTLKTTPRANRLPDDRPPTLPNPTVPNG